MYKWIEVLNEVYENVRLSSSLYTIKKGQYNDTHKRLNDNPDYHRLWLVVTNPVRRITASPENLTKEEIVVQERLRRSVDKTTKGRRERNN